MTVDIIRALGPGLGEAYVPEWGEDASDTWSEVEWRSFGSESKGYFGGGWTGEPGTLRCEPYPYDEVCVMISGRIALIDENGGRREFTSGEAFFVPKEFSGTWETVEPSKKIFVALPGWPIKGGITNE